MRYVLSLLVLSLLTAPLSAGSSPLGFSAQGAAALASLEERFDRELDPALLDEWLGRLAAHPHHVGSRWGKENAEYMAGLFREWGFETTIERYDVLFPIPTVRSLEMLSPMPFTASLIEEALAEDATSGQKDEQLPTYNAYSIDGDVTGELVYVNYGVPRRTTRSSSSAASTSRARSCWRATAARGAASSPRSRRSRARSAASSTPTPDDGYFAGDVYPAGGYRPAHGGAARLGGRHAALLR